MTSTKPAGQAYPFALPLVDAGGSAIVASDGTWQLLNDSGVAIATGSVDIDNAQAKGTIPAEAMTLAPGSSAAGVELSLTLTTAGGTKTLQDFFLIVDQRQPLTRFSNSVVSYPEALALRYEFGAAMAGWDAADMETRISALINAYRNLARATYVVRRWRAESEDVYVASYGTGCDEEIFDRRRRVRLARLDDAKFALLPEQFQLAIKRAQLVEADVILGGDETSRTRRDGIISETIGESSTFYNSKPFLNLPMSGRTYEILKPFIQLRITVGR